MRARYPSEYPVAERNFWIISLKYLKCYIEVCVYSFGHKFENKNLSYDNIVLLYYTYSKETLGLQGSQI